MTGRLHHQAQEQLGPFPDYRLRLRYRVANPLIDRPGLRSVTLAGLSVTLRMPA